MSRLIRALLLGVCVTVATVGVANAQNAWTPPPKTLGVDLSYQVGYGTHSENIEAPVTHHYVIPDIEYGIIENLAVDASLPILVVKADAGMFAHGSWDDGAYHSAPTDARATVRYRIPAAFLSITPQIGGSVPVRDYETRGFAAAGRHLKAAYFGINVGADLDEYIPRTIVHLMYEFALVEKFKEAGAEGEAYSQNYSVFTALIGHNIGRFGLFAGVDYHHNHDGIGFDDFGTISQNLRMHHDGLLIERIVLLGGGASYSITDNVDIYANIRIFTWGENTHDSSIFALGASWDHAF
jgi:hypothetical protein